MFDIGWSEMAIVLLVALIIIGPRDLPKVARTAGRWIGKARALARDFQRSLEDIAREAELDEIKKGIEKVGSADLKGGITKTIDPEGELSRAFDFSDADEKPAADGGKDSGDNRTEGPAAPSAVGEETATAAPGEERTVTSGAPAAPASQPEKS